MTPDRVAELLVGSVDDWEPVAEVIRPGATRGIAAVRDGDALTESVHALFAVRVLAEVAEPQAAAAGDKRATVRIAAGTKTAPDGERTAPASPEALKALFTGDPATISAAILERPGRLEAEHVDAWLALPEDIRAGTEVAVATRAAPLAPTARVLADCAERRGRDVILVARQTLEYFETAPALYATRARLTTATAAALGAWLRDNRGSAPWQLLRTEHPMVFPDAVPHAAGLGLAALAGALDVAFAGPETFAREAVRHLRRGPARDHPGALATAARGGLPWADVRDALLTDFNDTVRPMDATTLIEMVSQVAASDAGVTFAVELVRAEIPSLPLATTATHQRFTSRIWEIAKHLTAAEVLRLCAVTNYSDTSPEWAGTVWAYLLSANGPTAEQVRAAAAADSLIDWYLDAAAVTLAGDETHMAAADSASSGADVVLERAAALAPVATLLRTMHVSGSRRLTGAWARHCEQLLGDVASPSTWGAVCTLAPKFDGTTAELVDVALAAIG